MSTIEQSNGLRLVRAIAESEAAAGEFSSILPEHLWMALSRIGEMPEESAPKLFEKAEDREQFERERRELCGWFDSKRIEISAVRRALREALGIGAGKAERPHRSLSSKDAYRAAEKLARADGSARMTMLHLCQALYNRPERILAAVLGKSQDQRLSDSAMSEKLKAAVHAAPLLNTVPQSPVRERRDGRDARDAQDSDVLAKFGRDLVELGRKGRLNPVIGRQDEMRRLVQILGQRQKCNALLVGEPGVGKTQLVEGLAQRIASAECPKVFRNKRIVQLSINSLLAGAQYRGDFEERLEKIIKEAENDPNLILFIDEFHTAVGAGKSGGALDASNILKPALGRGSIRVIGATTAAAYEEHIARDAALARRFDIIWVEEPSRHETLLILDGVKGGLEKHHKLTINLDAIEAAIDLSMRYMPDRRLPDKAIDLIDQACAQRMIPTINPGQTRVDIDFSLKREDVARVVAARTRIPLDLLMLNDSQRLNALESRLNMLVFGQTDAMAKIAKDLRAAYSGLRDPKRPIASFLFAGPTGVGKSETAKALAELIFGHADSLITIDLTEYSEKHQLARMIGAPPGYVGYQEPGVLTAALRRRPASLVLFDEIEKAHPDVLNILLQILDEGRLTDGQSRTASFRESIVVLTANIGSTGAGSGRVGFRGEHAAQPAEERLNEALKEHLRPELLGRIRTVVEFKPLDKAAIEAIVRRAFAAICKRAAAQKPARVPPLELCETIVAEIAGTKQGAREAEKYVENRVATWLDQSRTRLEPME